MKKNVISFLWFLLLLVICNLIAIHFAELGLESVAYYAGEKISVLISILFVAFLLFFNGNLLLGKRRKAVKQVIRQQLSGNVFIRKLNYILLAFLILFSLFMFRWWNIDLIIGQRFTEVSRLVNSIVELGKESDDETKIVWGAAPVESITPLEVMRSDIYSGYGRFIRTYRWHQLIAHAEKKYGIEKNLLAGLIMQESMGNPLELNNHNDGGAGLLMFQPGTAREYGLKTYGTSLATGRDRLHGEQLRRLVEQKQYNYNELSLLDERFHVQKSVNAGAKFLSGLHRKYQSWDKAISAYNRGTPAPLPFVTRHVRQVRYFQKQYVFFINKMYSKGTS